VVPPTPGMMSSRPSVALLSSRGAASDAWASSPHGSFAAPGTAAGSTAGVSPSLGRMLLVTGLRLTQQCHHKESAALCPAISDCLCHLQPHVSQLLCVALFAGGSASAAGAATPGAASAAGGLRPAGSGTGAGPGSLSGLVGAAGLSQLSRRPSQQLPGADGGGSSWQSSFVSMVRDGCDDVGAICWFQSAQLFSCVQSSLQRQVNRQHDGASCMQWMLPQCWYPAEDSSAVWHTACNEQ
jgi:hypothetical protein